MKKSTGLLTLACMCVCLSSAFASDSMLRIVDVCLNSTDVSGAVSVLVATNQNATCRYSFSETDYGQVLFDSTNGTRHETKIYAPADDTYSLCLVCANKTDTAFAFIRSGSNAASSMCSVL